MTFKRSIIMGCWAAMLSAPFFVASAQSETDAIRYASTDLNGSARFQSMAGAFGSVGADYSSIQQNPAGIALNRKYMGLSATIDLRSMGQEARWYKQDFRKDNSRLSLSDISFAGAMPLNNDVGFSYGFGGHRIADLHRKMNIQTTGARQSLADYTAAVLNNLQHRDGRLISHTDLGSGNGSVWMDSSIPWLGVMGFEGGWIDSNSPKGGVYYPRYMYGEAIESPRSVEMELIESGDITAYDGAFGFNIKDVVYLGMSVNASAITHRSVSNYTEWYLLDEGDGKRDFLGLDSDVSSTGFGAGFGVGAIVEPVDGLRFGLSYFTPTWYVMNRSAVAKASSRYGGDRIFIDKGGKEVKELSIETPDARTEYTYSTPGRFVASASYIFGQVGLLSMDYEYRDMGTSKLGDSAGWRESNSYAADNAATKEDFGSEHCLRIGGEIRPTNRLSVRGGYMMRTASIKNELLKDFASSTARQEVLVAGTTPHYILPGSRWAVTSGLGYRFSPSIYGDLAVVWTRINAHFYTFPFINDSGIQLVPGQEGAMPEARKSQEAVALQDGALRVSFTLGIRL